jgi:PIN domain nuclease of toxin-antitoxin system
MSAIVADTHAAVWYLTNNPKLSKAAAQALDGASASGDPILIPAISLVELTYLVEKGRIPPDARKKLVELLAIPGGPYELAPLDADVAEAVELIDRHIVPDLPDRVIAATALARISRWRAATRRSDCHKCR